MVIQPLSTRLIKPNFCSDLSHRRSTTVSLETRNSFREVSDQNPDLTFMNVLNEYLRCLLMLKLWYNRHFILEKKCADDPKDTANIFNIFLASLGKTSYRTKTPLVNHRPSFYLRVNYTGSIYVSFISHGVCSLIDSFSV